MLDTKEFLIIKEELNSIFRCNVKFIKIKESPWGSVYFLSGKNNKYILKVGVKQLDGTGVGNEYNVLKLLKRHKIKSIPNIRYFRKLKCHYFLIEEFVNSTEVFDFYDLGVVFGRVHSIQRKIPGFNYYYFFKDILIKLRNI